MATTAPNFARGSVLLLAPAYHASWGRCPESFGKDLDYVEELSARPGTANFCGAPAFEG